MQPGAILRIITPGRKKQHVLMDTGGSTDGHGGLGGNSTVSTGVFSGTTGGNGSSLTITSGKT